MTELQKKLWINGIGVIAITLVKHYVVDPLTKSKLLSTDKIKN